MLFHVLRMKFRDDASEADVEALLAEMRQVKDTAVCCIGQDMDLAQDGFTHVYCVGFVDTAQFEKYMTQPGHREMVGRSADLMERFRTIDFSDDMDPALGQWMIDALTNWMKPAPELAARLEALQTA